MRIASLSLTEELRLKDLYSYDLLDFAPELEFDDLVELAAHIVGCPMAAITFIDETRQWLKSKKGLAILECPREISFCTHTIERDEVMIVNDALQDERFATNPLVIQEPFIRFYAGAPIRSEAGHNLGAICVIDQKPNALTTEQIKALAALSRQISKLLELRQRNKLLKERAETTLQAQKKILHKTISKHEKEALDASMELHENIAQGLAATKFYLEIAEADPSSFLLKKSRENIGKMIEDTRALSKKLFPSTLRHTGFADLASHHIIDFMEQTGVETEFLHSGDERIHSDLSLALYRITEEQLKNIRQHANASKVWIDFSVGDAIRLSIRDNGFGLAMHDFKLSCGMNKIVSLVEFYGGTVDVNSAVDDGCSLDVCIPVYEGLTVHPEPLLSCV